MRAHFQILPNSFGGFLQRKCVHFGFPKSATPLKANVTPFSPCYFFIVTFYVFWRHFLCFSCGCEKHFCNLEIKSNLMVTFVGFSRTHTFGFYTRHMPYHMHCKQTHTQTRTQTRTVQGENCTCLHFLCIVFFYLFFVLFF